MLKFLRQGEASTDSSEVYTTVAEGLKSLYKKRLLPLETFYKFHEFHSPKIEDADFDAKPMILLVGQYSTGKTTFIQYLLGNEFPGMRIGPEPTTDCFTVVMYDQSSGTIPGNALVVDPKRQFRALSKFGNTFLNRFQCSHMNHELLKHISIIDTPGVLSGEKHRVDRGYDFTGVISWLAERVDRIILLFDAHKLDISDEFRRCIEALRGYDEKIRIVLNKSDMVTTQQLMRVYGALMWSLGKVMGTPEVSRVYIGSFWGQPLHYDENRHLFEVEQEDLFRDLKDLPRNATLRKLNDLIKRARLAKVHGHIISRLKKEMPHMFGKDNKKQQLINDLGDTYITIQRESQISTGDFPNLSKMKELLQQYEFAKFHGFQKKLFDDVDVMLSRDISALMSKLPREEERYDDSVRQGSPMSTIDSAASTPFALGRGEGIQAGADDDTWVVRKDMPKYSEIFATLSPVNGKIGGATAKIEMVKSKLPNSELGKIWKLADLDRDGQFDELEFALAMYLIDLKLKGHHIPNTLPDHLIPPEKRRNQKKSFTSV